MVLVTADPIKHFVVFASQNISLASFDQIRECPIDSGES
jgi:hypothetical protein